MKKHRKEKRRIISIFKNLDNNKVISKAKEQFLEMADMPIYLEKTVTRATILNNSNIFIEQYLSIIDYFSNYIKIRCEKFDIIIEGKDLNIDEINKEDLIIKGNIYSINYKSR